MAKFTFNKIIEANNVAKVFFQRNTKETIFSKSLERFFELARPFIEDKGGYNERANKINRDAAAKDPKRHGVIINDQYGIHQYTASGLQRRDDGMNLLGEEKIEFEPEFCPNDEVPPMSLSDQMILKGIVLSPDYSSAEKKSVEVPVAVIEEIKEPSENHQMAVVE